MGPRPVGAGRIGGGMSFKSMLEQLEQVQSDMEREPDPKTDTEALVRVQVANRLAEVIQAMRALAADEWA